MTETGARAQPRELDDRAGGERDVGHLRVEGVRLRVEG